MATNYIQPGRTLTVTAPTGGVASGDGVLVGQLFGVAQHDAAEADELELLTEGVVELAKATPLAIAAGDRLFWDATNKRLDKTATAQVCVGLAVLAAADADATVRLKLVASTPGRHMTAIAQALDALFADPNLARDAVYRPGTDAEAAIRVVLRQPDRLGELGDTRIAASTTTLDVRMAELPAPKAGDRIEIDGATLVIQGEPLADAERLLWTIEARPA